MKTCRDKQVPTVPISSREAAERAAALTKEENVIWESQRSFSIYRTDSDSENIKHVDNDLDQAQD
jgi:hypothetical protein